MTNYEQGLKLLDAEISSAGLLSNKRTKLEKLRLEILRSNDDNLDVISTVNDTVKVEDSHALTRSLMFIGWCACVVWLLCHALSI